MSEENKSPVNRGRRALYAFATTGLCILTATGIAVTQDSSMVAQQAVDGLLYLSGIVTVRYIGGSVADSTGMMQAFAGRNKRDPET